ncbi:MULTISPECIES: flavin reductase family protein [unclassified Streptomyces]|uniref:flavin reductase family protein n=1 Tax=unclassified Streptomyces TaxID=2593676 RepID=UPI0006C1F3CF|nr:MULTISPECIES: flavin reductase family protein [unclassified Streptomyces]KOX36555.1 flavin oxidoreductase [Streptomyces sp. NRRL F-6491]KOX51747.1 flavin oxidoreductase [Streptomyces sp. NRRL F-6492]
MYVVTAATADGERAGCLVGFASPCSVDPPLFMAWLSTANRTYRVARRASHLAVHLLRSDQKETAALFGGRTGDDTDKFARVEWRPGEGGAPVLADSRAWLVGRVLERFEGGGGDHVGFLLAPVEQSPPDPGGASLLRLADVADLTPGHPA